MAKIKVKFNQDDFNDLYLPYLDNATRFLLFYGGAGSGKSVFVAQRSLLRCLKERYYRLLFCRKVGRSVRNSQFLLFKDLISKGGLSSLFTIIETTMEIRCINGNILMAAGLDDREKIKSIQEPTEVWCEEATEFSKEDILQLNLRLRTKKSAINQVILSFNPLSQEHWLYDTFWLKKEFQSKIIHSNYLHNKFLPDDYRQQLEALKNTDENYYKVYALGEWGGKIKGQIYTHWQICNELPDGGDVIYGIDFGFNNPTAVIKLSLKDNCLYAHQMLYRSGLTNADLIAELRGMGIGRAPIYADAAEPQRIEEIYRAGFNVKPAAKGPDSVRKGIDVVKSKPLFLTAESTDVIKEIRAYKWLEDRNGNAIRDEPVKFLDHAMDALRYAISTHLSQPSGVYSVA